MAWDFEQCLEILARHDCVAACLAGHDHKGGYALDDQGVHHVTLQSPLNKGDEGSGFGVLGIYDDCLLIRSPAVCDVIGPKDVEEKLGGSSSKGAATVLDAECARFQLRPFAQHVQSTCID